MITNTNKQITTYRILDATVDTDDIADDAVTLAKVKDASLDGTIAKEVADDNAIGGMVVVHRIELASGADADHDVTLTHKERVLDAWVALKGAGTAGSIVTFKNGANAISDAIDVSGGGDKDVFRIGEIDDAQHEIAAGGTLRVSTASTGGDFPGAEAYVLAIRVA